jgi:cytochrome c-type biogenesis protein CcmH
MQAAPVSSLVGGLEQRLAAQPNDADGWALLAQSYAFMGDAAAADGAIKKAAALGVDERELRARVDSAMRGPHPN